MAWINTIPYDEATGPLLELYNSIKGPDDNVDNIMLAHSLRPHTMEGHMALYKYVLHHPDNSIQKWFLEAIGVYTSMLNKCSYCVTHHYAGMTRLLKDESRARDMRAALESSNLSTVFDAKETAALDFVRMLTKKPALVTQNDVQSLREAGWDDGEILEINQVTAYFAYANRTVLGLGINTEDDIIGLSPSDSSDPNNWQHQ